MSELPTIRGHRPLRLLGEGGMGRVFLAEDETLGRRVAIKVVSDRFVGDAEARARFLREARSMATVEHPHVVRVYSFGEDEGKTFLVMEYVEGEVLSARLKRLGRLSVDEALAIARQVVEALEAAWEKRLVHRDIKPSNVILDSKGQVHVADFGLAKPIEVASDDASLTHTGSILGTPHYISPEQARGKSVDFRSDIYSLGIVLFEMLAGQRPYEGTTPFDVVARHLHEPLPSLAQRRPDVSPAVVELVEWMTQKDPDCRPPSYAALRSRLVELTETGGVAASPTGTMRTTARAGAATRRTAVLAALLLAAAGLYAWWGRSQRGLPEARDRRLVVAVTPFYGPDEDSAKEGRMMAALIERAIGERLRSEDVRVLGVDETKQPVRDHAAARALGERLGANAVVWGEAFALRGETEIQPYLTLVSRRPGSEQRESDQSSRRRDPLDALKERAGGSMVMGAQAANQIELRKTGAKGVGDMVLMLAGMHALYTEGQPKKAFDLFAQAPKTAETLRHRAEALLQLGKPDDARQALEEATRLDPGDAQAWGSLGDALLQTDRFGEAVAAYRHAADGEPTTLEGALVGGRLYRPEKLAVDKSVRDGGYLLAQDPDTGKVVERYRLPGPVRSLRAAAGALDVTFADGPSNAPFEATATLKEGRFSRPLFYGTGLRVRRDGILIGRALVANFLSPTNAAEFKPQGNRPDLPRTFPELEAALRSARDHDPTQPWHAFYLGQAAWAQGRKDEAAKVWQDMLAGAYPAIPYYEYAQMAADFDLLGQPEWADRTFAEALARRRKLAQPIMGSTLIERLINAWFVFAASNTIAGVRHDYDRAHVWLVRARELTGPTEDEALVAAAWAQHFQDRGDLARAAAERAYAARARASGFDFGRFPTWIDYATTPFIAANLAFWILLVLASLAARRGGIASLPEASRRPLIAAGALALASYVPVALLIRLTQGVSETPIGLSDALGSDSAVRQVDQQLERAPSQATRWVAAVAHHLAGDTKRAEELYRALSGPRAKKNLEAMAQGSLDPPEPVTGEDALAAYEAHTAFEWLSSLWRCPEIAAETWGAGFVVLVGVPPAATLLLLVAVLTAFGFARPHAGAAVGTDRPWRRHAVLLCCGAVAWALGAALLSHPEGGAPVPHPGLFTAWNISTLNGFPKPPQPSYWAYFWAYTGAKAYWSAVAATAVFGSVLLMTGGRRAAVPPRTAAHPDPDQETLARG